MALRGRKTINQEGNTPATQNLQENNEKSLIDTIRKIVRKNLRNMKSKLVK